MENPDMEKPPSDGLEITSIGSLYGGGTWDKKYWSCSRGKDRYPYPIGYRAVRTHAGNTYRMEILEGPKGPLFVITSMNGDSCFGQTPDIAWENFQKKSCPRVKTWHAKRFSCKIDGVELFGFKNSFVLRLLRQLVANVNVTAECSSTSTNICNGASSRPDYEKLSPELCTYPDLLPFLGRPESTRKRSQKKKRKARNAICELSLKKLQTQGLSNAAKVGIAMKGTQGNTGSFHEGSSSTLSGTLGCGVPVSNAIQLRKHNNILVDDKNSRLNSLQHYTNNKCSSITSFTSDRNCAMHEYKGTVPVPVDLAPVAERGGDPFVDGNDLQLGSPDFSESFFYETIIAQVQSKLVAFEKPRLTVIDSELSEVSKKQIDRSSDVDLQVVDSLAAAKENDELMIPPELKSTKEFEYHVSDTLDSLQDNIADCASRSSKGSLHDGKHELVVPEQLLENSAAQACVVVAKDMPNELNSENAKFSSTDIDAPPTVPGKMSCHAVLSAEPVLTQGLIMGLHSEQMVTSGNSNISSEKSDSDSNGQELLKSMMSFLLPQALPLLNKTSKKRRAIAGNANTHFTRCDPQLNLKEMKSQYRNGGTHSLTDIVSQGSLEIVRSVIPDSLEDDQTGCDVTNERLLHFSLAQADDTLFDKKICNADVLGLCGDANGGKEFSDIYCENGAYNGIIHEEVEMLLEKGENLISDSPIHCTPPKNQIPSEEGTDNECMKGFENDLHAEVQNIILSNGFPDNPGFRNNKITVGSSLAPLSSNAESLEHGRPTSIRNLGTVDSEVLESVSIRTHRAHDSPGTDSKVVLDQHHLENSDVDKLPLIVETRGDGNEDGVGTTYVPLLRVNGKTAVVTCDTSVDAATSTGYYSLSSHPSRKYNGPLSESIVCRNIKDSGNLETFSAMGAVETDHAIAADNQIHQILLANEVKLDKEHLPKVIPEPEGLFSAAPLACHSHASVIQAAENSCSQNACDHSVADLKGHQVDSVVNELVASYSTTYVNNTLPCFQKQEKFLSGTRGSVEEAKLGSANLLSDSKLHQNNLGLDGSFQEVPKPRNELEGVFEPVGCYVHPTPVLSILLRRRGDDIQICVLCGSLEDNDGTLFIYKLSIKGVEEDCPSFLGYTSIMLPPSKNTFDRDISFERCGIQFTADDRCLVLLNSIRVPCCREENINCLCLACTSDCCDENAVKVVRVQPGYVSVVVKLTATESVYCILVCEPCYLVAVGESGRLHVWIMNSTWSLAVDDFILPNFGYIFSSILELKRIPKCASLVVGHNGSGCFGLWDISKRIIIARFFGAGSILQALPVGLFSWQTAKCKVDKHIKEIKATTEMGSSGADAHNGDLPLNGEDIAVWLLVSAASDFDAELSPSVKCDRSPIGRWRLALLVKNTVIMGSILDPRASALDASGGHGIIGTCDGLVYMWELSTGKKLAHLHHFVGGGVSCIATEAEFGTLAVADNDGRLLVYVQHRRNCEAKEPDES